MKIPFTGTCQCGGVHYEVNKTPIATVACHCQDCQKLSASAFSITMLIQQDTFRLIRGELKMFETPIASGGSALCYFCSTCGNRVYHENPDHPGIYGLKPGGLDDTSEIIPQAHCWTSRAQPWFVFPPDALTFETQPDINTFLQ